MIELEGSAGCSEHPRNLERTDMLSIDLSLRPRRRDSPVARRFLTTSPKYERDVRTSRRWTVDSWNYILGIWKCEVNAY